jgi:hypothetical protein
MIWIDPYAHKLPTSQSNSNDSHKSHKEGGPVGRAYKAFALVRGVGRLPTPQMKGSGYKYPIFMN